MDVAPSPTRACPPALWRGMPTRSGVYARRWACAHSRLSVSDSRFLTPDFQFALAPALSTRDFSTFDSSTFLPSSSLSPLESMSMRPAPKRKSSGLKLFGMRKCTARTQESQPRKFLGMCALQSMRVSSPLESVFAKNRGVPPPAYNGGKLGERCVTPASLLAGGPPKRAGARTRGALGRCTLLMQSGSPLLRRGGTLRGPRA
jgi:hypothetical protein